MRVHVAAGKQVRLEGWAQDRFSGRVPYLDGSLHALRNLRSRLDTSKQSLWCFLPAKFLSHEEPHIRPPPERTLCQLLKCLFPKSALSCAPTHAHVRLACMWTRMFLCVRLCVSLCSFLVCGCEICGFSQSVLICVSLSLSQQIIVKYTHT